MTSVSVCQAACRRIAYLITFLQVRNISPNGSNGARCVESQNHGVVLDVEVVVNLMTVKCAEPGIMSLHKDLSHARRRNWDLYGVQCMRRNERNGGVRFGGHERESVFGFSSRVS